MVLALKHSSGFGAVELDSAAEGGENALAIDCGTEKGRHKRKNFRAAGKHVL